MHAATAAAGGGCGGSSAAAAAHRRDAVRDEHARERGRAAAVEVAAEVAAEGSSSAEGGAAGLPQGEMPATQESEASDATQGGEAAAPAREEQAATLERELAHGREEHGRLQEALEASMTEQQQQPRSRLRPRLAAVDSAGGSPLGVTPSSPAVRGAAGLANATGEYNCFLNVVVQSLWHLPPFRQQLLAIDAASGASALAASGADAESAVHEIAVQAERRCPVRTKVVNKGESL